MKLDDTPDLEGFANEAGRRGALGVVVALGFKEGVRIRLEDMGLKTLDTDDMLRIVGLWDPLKQRTAVASLVYYVRQVEKNSSLGQRLDRFLDETVNRRQTPSR